MFVLRTWNAFSIQKPQNYFAINTCGEWQGLRHQDYQKKTAASSWTEEVLRINEVSVLIVR